MFLLFALLLLNCCRGLNGYEFKAEVVSMKFKETCLASMNCLNPWGQLSISISSNQMYPVFDNVIGKLNENQVLFMKHHLKSDSHNVIKISTGILRYQGSTLKTCALSDEVSTFYHEINTIDFEFKSSGPCFESVVKVSKVGGPEKLWNDFTRFVRDNFEIITHILLIIIISVCIIALVYIILKLTYAKTDKKHANSEEPIYSPFKLTKKKDHTKFISISEVDMEHLTRSNSNDLNASAVIPIIYQNMIKDSEKWDHLQSMYHENMTYYNEESFQHSQTNSFGNSLSLPLVTDVYLTEDSPYNYYAAIQRYDECRSSLNTSGDEIYL